MTELYISTVFRGFAAGMLILFTPLYFLKLGVSVQQILLFVALVYLFFFVSSFAGAFLTAKFGHERTMGLATPLLLAYFAAMYLLPELPSLFYLAALILGLHDGLYWVAYHSEFAHYGDRQEMGKEIGFLKVLLGFMGVIAPAIGGIFVEQWGFGWLFVMAAELMLASLIPMFRTKEPWQPAVVNPYRIAAMFFSKHYRMDVLANLATGEETISSVVWPIFIFMIIPNYKDVGIITTLAIFLTFVVFLWLGRLTDHRRKSLIIARISGLITFSWLFRMFAFTPFNVLIADTIYKISAHSLSIPLTTLLYKRPRHDRIIEYTAFWMGSLSLGKLLAALLAWFMLFFTHNFLYTFVLAAGLSVLYFLWSNIKK